MLRISPISFVDVDSIPFQIAVMTEGIHTISSCADGSSRSGTGNLHIVINPVGPQQFPKIADLSKVIGHQKFLAVENMDHISHTFFYSVIPSETKWIRGIFAPNFVVQFW